VASLASLFSGHLQAKNVYESAKLAAFEGHYETGPADMSLIGVPDDETESVGFNVAVPGGLSFLVHEDSTRPVVGLDRFRPEDRPPVLPTYLSYHVMVGLGMAFIDLTLLGSLLHWRGRLFQTRWLMWVFVFAVVGPLIANQLGWVAAEVGRQPWIVHPPVKWTADGDVVVGADGVVVYDENQGLRSANAVSPAVSASQVLGSLIVFGFLCLALLATWLFVLDRKIRHGPEPVGAPRDETGGDLLRAVSGRAGHAEGLTGERG